MKSTTLHLDLPVYQLNMEDAGFQDAFEKSRPIFIVYCSDKNLLPNFGRVF